MGRQWWVLGVLLALMATLLRQELLLLMVVFLGLIGGASALWSRTCLSGVTYRRRFNSTRLFHGEETELRIELRNAKPLPLAWLRVEDEFPNALDLVGVETAQSHRQNRHILVSLVSMRWYEQVVRRYRVRGTRRGAWRVGPVELSSGDIFGFDIRRATVDAMVSILVYPKVVPLTALGMPAQRPFGELRTPRRLVEDPLRLMGARSYAAGDPFRHIHWKATARRRSLQTKVFEPSSERPLAIFLNVDTFRLRYEGQDPVLQELAITTAASIARWGWDRGDPIGLYVNSIVQPEAQRIVIRPAHNPDQLVRILEALTRVVVYGRWPLEAVVQEEAAKLAYGATVVVVTAIVTERMRHTLAYLHEREYGVALVTVGEAEETRAIPGVRIYHAGGREVWDELAHLALS